MSEARSISSTAHLSLLSMLLMDRSWAGDLALQANRFLSLRSHSPEQPHEVLQRGPDQRAAQYRGTPVDLLRQQVLQLRW